jgi:hypothetical protein
MHAVFLFFFYPETGFNLYQAESSVFENMEEYQHADLNPYIPFCREVKQIKATMVKICCMTVEDDDMLY